MRQKKIVDRNARETARLIQTCCKHFNHNNVKTVLCGGMCINEDILEPYIKKYLGKNHVLEFLTEPVVNGAVALAKANIKKNGEEKC